MLVSSSGICRDSPTLLNMPAPGGKQCKSLQTSSKGGPRKAKLCQLSSATWCPLSSRTKTACSVANSFAIPCDPMDSSPPGSSVRGIFPGENTGVDCRFLLQGIFPAQGLNSRLLCLLHWQVDIFCRKSDHVWPEPSIASERPAC